MPTGVKKGIDLNHFSLKQGKDVMAGSEIEYGKS